MPRRSSELSELRNIGPTIEQRLRDVAISTRSELEEVGPVEAYRRIRAKYPERTIPVCYYLYSFQGALLDLHWDELPEEIKASLRREARRRGEAWTSPVESRSSARHRPRIGRVAMACWHRRGS